MSLHFCTVNRRKTTSFHPEVHTSAPPRFPHLPDLTHTPSLFSQLTQCGSTISHYLHNIIISYSARISCPDIRRHRRPYCISAVVQTSNTKSVRGYLSVDMKALNELYRYYDGARTMYDVISSVEAEEFSYSPRASNEIFRRYQPSSCQPIPQVRFLM